jgi:AAHS family 4-hydroxybenzoate transporter-like MFS transporter
MPALGQKPQTVDSWLDARRLVFLQIAIFITSALVMTVDGFDLQALGLVAPRLAAMLGASPVLLSSAFSATLLGLGLGAAMFGPLGDRRGRRPILAAALIAISAISIATMFVTTILSLVILRFFLGLAMGAANVSALALTADFAPPRRRFLIMTLVVSNMATGSAIASAVAPAILLRFDWHGFFLVGGILPLLLLPVIRWLPESLGVLSTHDTDRFLAAARRLDSNVHIDDFTFAPASPRRRMAVQRLFSPGLRGRTITIWLTYGLGSFNLYLLMSWLPTFLHVAGFSEADALRGSASIQLGGLIGGIAVALVLDRGHLIGPLVAVYGLTVISLLGLGVAPLDLTIWSVALFVVGIGVFGNQVIVLNIATALYPPDLRATSSGWTTAVARVGSVLAPVAGGGALSLGVAPNILLPGLALPILMQIALLVGARRWITYPKP